jgi:hypothetical protein
MKYRGQLTFSATVPTLKKFYLPEDINTNGISIFHGPVKATPRWIYGVGR